MQKKKDLFIVAIDGPAGAGKSAVAKKIAERFGWAYVNTGRLYRAVGTLLDDDQIKDLEKNPELERWEKLFAAIRYDSALGQIFYEDKNISKQLMSPEVAQRASLVAGSAVLRKLLLPIQRMWALSAKKGCVVEGRDIGTVVFPDAQLKLYITASVNCRALRRQKQLALAGGKPETLEEIAEQISLRDQQDMQRAAAPLTKAADAVVIDTTKLDLSAVVQKIATHFEKLDLA